MKIGVLSDTHGHLDDIFLRHLRQCDAVWHAGDIGDDHCLKDLPQATDFRAVYGNIDGRPTRLAYPERLSFDAEGLKVCMAHIAGRPGRYHAAIREWISAENPHLFITGHSHLLVVEKTAGHLHINPGAAGLHGFHKVRTIVTLEIIKGKMGNLKVIELPRWPQPVHS